MPRVEYMKLTDRISIYRGKGSIQPQDWDTKIQLCIMQVCSLKQELDDDAIDPMKFIKEIKWYDPTDSPENVDPFFWDLMIGLNDALDDAPRQKLLQFVVPLSSSYGSERLTIARRDKLLEICKERGWAEEHKRFNGITTWSAGDPGELGRVWAGMIHGGNDEPLEFIKQLLAVQDPGPVQEQQIAA